MWNLLGPDANDQGQLGQLGPAERGDSNLQRELVADCVAAEVTPVARGELWWWQEPAVDCRERRSWISQMELAVTRWEPVLFAPRYSSRLHTFCMGTG